MQRRIHRRNAADQRPGEQILPQQLIKRRTLVTDGHDAHYSLDNGGSIRNVACLVHVRRKVAKNSQRANYGMTWSPSLKGRQDASWDIAERVTSVSISNRTPYAQPQTIPHSL